MGRIFRKMDRATCSSRSTHQANRYRGKGHGRKQMTDSYPLTVAIDLKLLSSSTIKKKGASTNCSSLSKRDSVRMEWSPTPFETPLITALSTLLNNGHTTGSRQSVSPPEQSTKEDGCTEGPSEPLSIPNLFNCTTCDRVIKWEDEEIHEHRRLKVLICKECHNFYLINSSNDTTNADDGHEEFCTVCGDGGELVQCDFCEKCVCYTCISRVSGKDHLNHLLSSDIEFTCYMCDGSPLLKKKEECVNLCEFLIQQKKGNEEVPTDEEGDGDTFESNDTGVELCADVDDSEGGQVPQEHTELNTTPLTIRRRSKLSLSLHKKKRNESGDDTAIPNSLDTSSSYPSCPKMCSSGVVDVLSLPSTSEQKDDETRAQQNGRTEETCSTPQSSGLNNHMIGSFHTTLLGDSDIDCSEPSDGEDVVESIEPFSKMKKRLKFSKKLFAKKRHRPPKKKAIKIIHVNGKIVIEIDKDRKEDVLVRWV